MGGRSEQGEENLRAHAVEHRMAPAVVAAALVSVPAVFCEVWGAGAVALAGRWVNTAAGAVLWAEWGLLLLLAESRRAWLREHWWVTLVAAVAVPAVVFAVGPLQLLRLVRVAASLHVLRASRILKAGRVLRRRTGAGELRRRALTGAVALLVAVFSLTVLADPESRSRRLAGQAAEQWGVGPVAGAVVLAAGLVLLAYALWRRNRPSRGGRTDDDPDENPDGCPAGSG